jgi:hypothetical protein
MIVAGKRKGWNAQRIADHINNTKTAGRMGLYYSTGTIAAKLANFTRDIS